MWTLALRAGADFSLTVLSSRPHWFSSYCACSHQRQGRGGEEGREWGHPYWTDAAGGWLCPLAWQVLLWAPLWILWGSPDGSLFAGRYLPIKRRHWEFPGGPVVKTWVFHCHGWSLVLGLGTKILQAMWGKKRKNRCIAHSSVSASASFCVHSEPPPRLCLWSVFRQARVNISIMGSSQPAGFPLFDLLFDLHLLPRCSQPWLSQTSPFCVPICRECVAKPVRCWGDWSLSDAGVIGWPPPSFPALVDDTPGDLLYSNLSSVNNLVCVCVCSVVSNSLLPQGLWPANLLCPWSLGKNVGEGCHFLLQGNFLTQGSNTHLLCLLHWQMGPGKPLTLFFNWHIVDLQWCVSFSCIAQLCRHICVHAKSPQSCLTVQSYGP